MQDKRRSRNATLALLAAAWVAAMFGCSASPTPGSGTPAGNDLDSGAPQPDVVVPKPPPDPPKDAGVDPTGMVPCPASPPSTDPRCVQNPPKQSVGAGIVFPAGATLNGGFVDVASRRIVLAAGGVMANGKQYGAIFTVDLATGNRTFVSGTTLDPAEGPKTAGAGPELLGSAGVNIAAGPDGWYVTATRAILKIDPVTGDRALAVDLSLPAFGAGTACQNQMGRLAIGPTGKIYRSFEILSNGKGIAELTGGATPTCRAVVNNMDSAVGSGLKPFRPTDLSFARGKLWAQDQARAIFSIDPMTFASRNETSVTTGSGDECLGIDGMAMTDDVIWNFNSESKTGDPCATADPNIVAVDPSNGKRTGNKVVSDGPRAPITAIVPIPGQTTQAFYLSKDAVYRYDAARHLVNVFSH
jgi:hypothetical protein